MLPWVIRYFEGETQLICEMFYQCEQSKVLPCDSFTAPLPRRDFAHLRSMSKEIIPVASFERWKEPCFDADEWGLTT